MMRGKNGEEEASALVSRLGLLQMAPGDKGQVAFLWAKFLKPQVKGHSQQWLLEEPPPQRALPGRWKNELAQA